MTCSVDRHLRKLIRGVKYAQGYDANISKMLCSELFSSLAKQKLVIKLIALLGMKWSMNCIDYFHSMNRLKNGGELIPSIVTVPGKCPISKKLC